MLPLSDNDVLACDPVHAGNDFAHGKRDKMRARHSKIQTRVEKF